MTYAIAAALILAGVALLVREWLREKARIKREHALYRFVLPQPVSLLVKYHCAITPEEEKAFKGRWD